MDSEVTEELKSYATPAENVTHKKVTLAKVTAKNDPPESTRKMEMEMSNEH